MAAVTQTIPNFLGGVSNQPDDKKLPGQVRKAINAYPDPTFGLTKRPGFKYRAVLKDSGGTAFDNNDLDNAKWFYINRAADEKYLGCIVGASGSPFGQVHIWNTVDNNVCTINHKGTIFRITDNGGDNGTSATLTNLATTVTKHDGSGSSGSGLTVDVKVADGVVVDIQVNTEGNTNYTVGDIITISKSLIAGTGAGSKIDEDVKCTIRARETIRSYFNATNAVDYSFLNVRDTSILTNKTTVIKPREALTEFTAGKVATIKIHLVEYASKYEVKITVGATTYTNTVNTRAGDTATNDTDTVNNQGNAFLSALEILAALKTAIDAHSVSGLTATIIGSSLEISHTAAFTISATGGKGSKALSVYQDEVDSINDLAAETIHNRTVKIVNAFSAAANYYTKFKANNSTSGEGVWEETIGPGEETGLQLETMPHKLFNTAKNVFTVSPVDFEDRLVGDSLTNKHPSFVVKEPDNTYSGTIQQAFYSNNRLGFLTADNVSMSQSSDFFNLYFNSAQTVVANDPIDLSCSSIREATLHGILPTASGLLLFSQNQQFIMYAADGNLSPQTAIIRGLSNYRMDTQIDPVDVGTYINFISKTHDTAGFSRIFAMLPQGVGQIPKVVDIGRSVSEYIPATITGLTANPQNSLIAMWGITDNKIYFYRTYSDGDKDLIQCWFNWECPGNTHYVTIDSDTMYSVMKTGTGGSARYTLVSATMTMTPEETIIVTADGQQINPHMDFYTAATNGLAGGSEKKVVYDSTNNLSKCYIPYTDLTSLTPVIIIAGNATSNFSGTTESGFTIFPERASDGDGTYFKVPEKDLSGQAANVYVGYKYAYDITLPKLYFRPDPDGRIVDYTAKLTVARCKFSIGKSSVVGFKLNRKGVQAATQSFTGDGTTTAFSPDFTVKDKADVVVKINGAKQTLTTDYTIADHAQNPDQITVTFGSAPAAATTVANVTTPAESIEIYVDNWYVLTPTQEANYYLGDDVPIEEQNVFVIPIHQKTDNYTLRVFSDSPFPVALTSMAWEGNYSPRYYRRT